MDVPIIEAKVKSGRFRSRKKPGNPAQVVPQLSVSDVAAGVTAQDYATEVRAIHRIKHSKKQKKLDRSNHSGFERKAGPTKRVGKLSNISPQALVIATNHPKTETKKDQLSGEDRRSDDQTALAVPATAVSQLTTGNNVNTEAVNERKVTVPAESKLPCRCPVAPAWNAFLENSVINLQSSAYFQHKHEYQQKLSGSLLMFLGSLERGSLASQLLDEYQVIGSCWDAHASHLRQLSSVVILLLPFTFKNSGYSVLVFDILKNAARHVFANDLMEAREVRLTQ
jgi:hypothetical protein